jgi:hypothetical protein
MILRVGQRQRVYYKRMLSSSIFVTKIHEEPECCKRFHNEELRDNFSSTNIFRMIRSRMKKLAGNVASVEEAEMY